MNTYNIHQGDSAKVLKQYPDNTFDSVVTDPPYGIEFLGKEWDTHTGTADLWKEVFRVLKPGGYLLAFSAPRTYHKLATNIEGAGFDIKDQIMWVNSGGFPKASDVGKQIQKKIEPKAEGCTDPVAKQWEGWKSALKPAHEPIVMARKPTKLTYAANVQEHGCGALNIDATRIPFDSDGASKGGAATGAPKFQTGSGVEGNMVRLDKRANNKDLGDKVPYTPNKQGRYPSNVIGEIEGYQKFFYCPKINSKERAIGLTQAKSTSEVAQAFGCSTASGIVLLQDGTKIMPHSVRHELELRHGKEAVDKEYSETLTNSHPTVKPVDLMRYLVKLVTPVGGLVLDPFNGSGSTGMAAVAEGCDYVGCDLDQHYVDVSNARIQGYIDCGFDL